MIKVFSLILCSLALCTNGLLNSSYSHDIKSTNITPESDVYEETIIGSFPNESSVNGFSHDYNELSLNSSYSSANMVNYDLEAGTTSFEYFNQDSYPIRNTPSSTSLSYSTESVNLLVGSGETVLTSNGFIPSDGSYSISTNSILGTDERVQVTNPSDWPYRATCKLYMEYDNVYNHVTGQYVTRIYVGTGFMEGPNLLVTAGHCTYSDVTSEGDYQDSIDNPRFPNRIRVYAGANGNSDINSSYKYFATVTQINIQKEYYENPTFDYDWAACELNWNLGNATGYYGKISNWYVQNSDIYSYGYPGDKPATMWETYGQMVKQTSLRYEYNFDTVGGQSGSPVFMTTDDGATYVCGIHTSGSSTINGGTKINSFIYHYLNSFVSNHNYEHSVGSISPNEYGFADAYPTDSTTRTQYKDHYTDKNFHFQTVRYRTGYIHNEYIVMSCMRENVTEAFIEYKFDTPISKLTVQLSHWRERSVEWLDKNTGMAELQYWDNNKWNQKLDLLSDETALPRDRTNPKTYTVIFDEPVTRIRFYEKANLQYFNDNNRGRICIGDITFYSKEGNI